MPFYQLRVERPLNLRSLDGRTAIMADPGTALGLHLTGNVSVINAVPETIYAVPDLPDLVADGMLSVFRVDAAPLPKIPGVKKKEN